MSRPSNVKLGGSDTPVTGSLDKATGTGGKGKNAKKEHVRVNVTPVPNASKKGAGGRTGTVGRENKPKTAANISLEASGTKISKGGRKVRGGRNDASPGHDTRVGEQKSEASELDVVDKDPKTQETTATELPKMNSIEKSKEYEMLRTNLKLKSEELQKSAKDLQAITFQLKNVEAERMQREIELKDLREKTSNMIKELTATNDELTKRLNTAEKECEQREKELSGLRAATSNRIQELTAANDELRTRLSKHLGAKLQDNNPNIADLSDPNRPTKLAEQFSGLYDDEWTNSFEVMKKHKNEVDVIHTLRKACLKIYSHCYSKASTELQDLHRVLLVFNSKSDVQLQNQLKDRRKKLKPDEQLHSKIETDIKELFGEKIAKHKKIIPYVQKCLEICWYMVIQDPPVHMDTFLDLNGQPFNNVAYRPYIQSGPLVDFIVWPALYLHKDGSLLQKGVAQGMAAGDSVGGRQSSRVNEQKRVNAS